MPIISTSGRRFAALLLVLAATGCGDKTTTVDTLPRKAVTGTVTLDDQPLAQGKIQFDPVGGEQGATAIAVADINDGKFSIDRAMGPVPGKYKVSISSVPSIKIGANELPGTRPKVDPEKVPAQYNTNSTLTKDIAEVNTFEFALKSK